MTEIRTANPSSEIVELPTKDQEELDDFGGRRAQKEEEDEQLLDIPHFSPLTITPTLTLTLTLTLLKYPLP